MHNEHETELRDSIDHLFRRYAGQMVSILARRFGFQNLEVVEDAVQDALIAAMKKWPFIGMPENPRAWLITTAGNRIIDQLRRNVKSEVIEDVVFSDTKTDSIRFSGEVEEDELRMIFACCHPAISPDSQVALTLKTVGGFSVAEIARAFLSNNDAVAKMLTRAKARLRENAEDIEIPSQEQLVERREAVLKVLYLMFNEGYAASEGEELVRKDLCFEAIRLAVLIAEHLLTAAAKVDALLALFYFQAARLETRIDQSGELLLLEDQDRERWDKRMLTAGLRHFRLSASGHELSDYHLEAEIAAVHALAADFASTDWKRILDCYEALQSRKFSPVVELNRIVAIEKLYDVEAAQIALENLANGHDLSRFNLFHITRSHLSSLKGNFAAARSDLAAALELTSNLPVRRFIQRKLDAIDGVSCS